MITRLFYSCLAMLLIAPSAWAQEQQGDPAIAQSAPVISAPVHNQPAKPATSASAQASPAEPTQPAPAKPATVQAPAPVQPPVIKSASAPASSSSIQASPKTPVPVKPATAPVPAMQVSPPIPAPAKPSPVQVPPARPAQAQPSLPKPVAEPLPPKKQALPAKPAASSITNRTTPAQAASSPESDDTPGVNLARPIDIEVFVREGCLQCDKATEFLVKLKSLQPQVNINIRDVRKEPAAQELLKRMTESQGDAVLDYPAFVMRGQLIVGFSEEANTAQRILDKLAENNPDKPQTILDAENCKTGKELSCGLITLAAVEKPEKITIHFLGYSIPLVQIGLPLFTVAMGVLDGFNHGSTWILILMISLLAPAKNRTVMFAVAGTFIAVQALVYFIYMSAWLNIFKLAGTSYISEIVIATIAMLAGAVYFKNYRYFGHNIAHSNHEISKPGIYTRIRKILQAESITTALMGTTALAVLVQLGEFSYKSIFPAMYTRILTLQHLDGLSNYGFLLLYDLAYMLDDMIVLTIGVITLDQVIAKDMQGRMLLLISGLTMVSLGAYMLLMLH